VIRGFSRDFQEFRFAPGIFALFSFGADSFDEFRLDGAGRMTPFAPDESQDRGDLVVIKNAEGRHVELKGPALDIDWAVQTVQNNPHEPLRRTEHPFRFQQRRREPFLAHPVRLVARSATDQEQFLALVEPFLFLSRQGPDGDFRCGARLARPGDQFGDFPGAFADLR